MSYQTNSLGSEEMEVGTWKPTLYNTAHMSVSIQKVWTSIWKMNLLRVIKQIYHRKLRKNPKLEKKKA